MFAVLQEVSFRRLWLSSLVSVLGDWLLQVALPLWVLALSGSALATGLTLLSATAPRVLLAPLAGALADRLDRRRLMVACDLSRAAVLPLLLLVHSPGQLWAVYAVNFALACASTLFDPASRALVPQLLDGVALVRAAALLAVANDAMRLIGPALGGLLYAARGLSPVVWLDALSFLASALLILGVRVPKKGEADRAELTAGRFSQGWQWVWRQPTLRILLFANALSSVKEGVYNVLGAVFVIEILHAGASGRGFISSAQALGGLLGGVLVGHFGARWPARWAIGLGLIGNGACLLAIFTLHSYPLALFFSAACGLPLIASEVMQQATVQTSAPPAVLGRVFGIFGLVGGAALLLSQGAASALGDHLSVVWLLSVSAVFELLAGLLVLLALPTGPRAVLERWTDNGF